MRLPIIVIGAALALAAAPARAQRGGGGHAGGGRGSFHFGGGHVSVHSGVRGGVRGVAPAAHFAPPARMPASSADGAGRTFIGGNMHWTPPPRPASANSRPTGRMIWIEPRSAAPTRTSFAATGSRMVSASPRAAASRAQSRTFLLGMAQPAVFPRRTISGTFFFGQPFFFRRGVVIFIGNGFFCDRFFFQPIFFDPFLFNSFAVNPFCPFCATGRVFPQPFFSPFGFHRLFGGGFFPFDGGFGSDARAMSAGLSGQAAEPAEQVPANEPPSTTFVPETGAAQVGQASRKEAPLPPVTLVVFKDGSIYGLTDYWLANGLLHYITNYGGENAVALDQIDLDTTAQMNWERGTPFVLRPKP